jgi:hypothetical protein
MVPDSMSEELKKYQYIVTELDRTTGTHTKYYLLPKTDSYRASVSLNAFAWGTRRYNRSINKWYIFRLVCDIYPTDIMLNILEEGNCIRCEGIFDFYKKIGFDYKKKNFDTRSVSY